MSESAGQPEVVLPGQGAIVCVVIGVCVHVRVCRSVCVAVGWAAGAACGRVSVHLPRHGPNVLSVPAVPGDGVQRAAAYVPRPTAVCVALGVDQRPTVCVIQRRVGPAACVSLCVSVVVAFPVQVAQRVAVRDEPKLVSRTRPVRITWRAPALLI